MKKGTSISFVVLATLILFTLSIFPHHHHEGIPCILTELCENIHDDDHGHDCTADQPYIHSQSDTRVKHSISHRDFFPLQFLVTSHTDDITQPSFTRLKNEYIFLPFYTSADVNRLNGLRAPPYPLS